MDRFSRVSKNVVSEDFLDQIYIARLKNGDSLQDIEESDFFLYFQLLCANEESEEGLPRQYID